MHGEILTHFPHGISNSTWNWCYFEEEEEEEEEVVGT
jgi:hypothetical protein